MQTADSNATSSTALEVDRVQGIADGAGVQSPAARQLSLHISGPSKQEVAVQLLDRGGDVRISVRTPDADLSQAMRSQLSDLESQLRQKGFHAEMWTPVDGASAPATSTGAGQSGNHRGTDTPGQGGQQSGYSGGQQRQDQQRPKWVDEMAESFESENQDEEDKK